MHPFFHETHRQEKQSMRKRCEKLENIHEVSDLNPLQENLSPSKYLHKIIQRKLHYLNTMPKEIVHRVLTNVTDEKSRACRVFIILPPSHLTLIVIMRSTTPPCTFYAISIDGDDDD